MIFLGRKLKFVTQYSVGLVFYSVLRLFSVVGWLAAIGILIVLCLGCVLLYCLLKCFRALKSGRRDRIHGKVRTSEQTPLHQHVSVLFSETFIKQSGMNIHHFGIFPSFLIVPFFPPVCSAGKSWMLHHRNARKLDIALRMQLFPSLVPIDHVFARGKQCYVLRIHMFLLWILVSTLHRKLHILQFANGSAWISKTGWFLTSSSKPSVNNQNIRFSGFRNHDSPNGYYSRYFRSPRSCKQELELQTVSGTINNGNKDSLPVTGKDK